MLIDIQNKFARSSEEIARSLGSRLGYINEVSAEFRRTGNPVIAVMYDGESYGSEGIEDPDDPAEGLAIEDTDIIVHKRTMNSFRDSGLAGAVRDMGCDGVVLAGMVAHYCVLSTYYAAFDHGIVPYILKGGIAAKEEEIVSCVERITKAVDLDDIRKNVHFGGKGSE